MHERRVALITGANKGIGAEIARQLARQDITVVIGARNRELGDATAATIRDEGHDARMIVLDVTRADTIAAAASWLEHELGRLDILVNNAGIVRPSNPPSTAPLANVREVFDTNVFGVIAVTQAMLPLLRAAPAGRIVNVSSRVGSFDQLTDSTNAYRGVGGVAYAPSKAALNAVTVAFAQELDGTSIKINAACPGYTATDLNHHSGPRTVVQGARTPVRLATLGSDGPSGGFFNDDGSVPW